MKGDIKIYIAFWSAVIITNIAKGAMTYVWFIMSGIIFILYIKEAEQSKEARR